jgi:predicted ferric reductase
VNHDGWHTTAPSPARPIERGRHGRWLVLTLFWVGLGVGVLPWWLDTAPATMSEPGAVLTAAGRITGLAAGYVLLAQVLLMSRLGWLERSIGASDLMLWHRELGGFLVVAVLAHTMLITIGYARGEHVSVFGQTWTFLTQYADVLRAFAATALLVGVGVLAIRSLRAALPYEVWYFLHVTAYLVLLLGFSHQFADGQDLAEGFARYYWIGLYLAVIAAVLWGRLVAPLRLNLRHRLRVMGVVDEAPGVTSVYITGRGLDRLDAKAGQFFRWRFLAPGMWWQAHPFSLSAAPNDQWLRLTIKTVGDHTAQLRRLRPGIRVYAEGPAGEFTADRRTRSKTLLIAAGSGIAPIRALLEELPPGAVVVYRAATAEDLVFKEELESLAEARGATLWYVLGSRDDPGPRRLFTRKGLHELVPDVARRDVYLCGPDGLITTSVRLLRRLGVRRHQIHLDAFEF